jgi:hypothetical protein
VARSTWQDSVAVTGAPDRRPDCCQRCAESCESRRPVRGAPDAALPRHHEGTTRRSSWGRAFRAYRNGRWEQRDARSVRKAGVGQSGATPLLGFVPSGRLGLCRGDARNHVRKRKRGAVYRWAACGPRAVVLAADRRVRGSPARRHQIRPGADDTSALQAEPRRARGRRSCGFWHPQSRARGGRRAQPSSGPVGPVAAQVTPIQSAISAARSAVMPGGRCSPRTWIGHKRQRGITREWPHAQGDAVSAGCDSNRSDHDYLPWCL